MEDIGSTTQPSQLFLTPLMISMVGLTSTALAIVVYHFVLIRYCLRRPNIVETINQPLPGDRVATGVDEKVLDSIPIIPYLAKRVDLFRGDESECAVCLGELEEGDMVRLLPNCRHAFHLHCIGEWFVSHSNCPLCRLPIVEAVSFGLTTPAEGDVEEHINLQSQSDQFHGADQEGGDHVVGSNSLLRHSASLVLPVERIPHQAVPKTLIRSLSMDHSYVSLKIQGDHGRSINTASNSSSLPSSSSVKGDVLRSRVDSFKRLDRASLMLLRSLSRLRIGSTVSRDNHILPY